MYSIGMKKHIVDDTSFKTCLQLLKFSSKSDLLSKFDKVIFNEITLVLLFIFMYFI